MLAAARQENRRSFLARLTGAAAGLATAASRAALPSPSPARLPRWRGFNLLEMFNGQRNRPFVESDFEWMAGWGFDFVRLPLSYHCWSKPDDWLRLDETVISQVDQAVAYGQRHGIHVNINFHRAPGYCVNPPAEPLSLWSDDEALDAACFHWRYFARRYQGIPNDRVSFDLLNEPANVPEPVYQRVVQRLVEAIRAEDPQRLIIADGARWGRDPVWALVDLGVGQSTRGYDPMRISHYRASWVNGSDSWPEPEWPLREGDGQIWDRERLRRERIEPWRALQQRGVGVHVGEWGAFNQTPHRVALAWMKDNLELWREADWGWALWNLRGTFGVLDSRRGDVTYDSFQGHRLDRAMLELLQSDGRAG